MFEKSNEITAIPALVERLDLTGALVSIDAMGCNPTIAQSILDAEADYLLAVKDNQPTLHADIESYFDTAPPRSSSTVRQCVRCRRALHSALLSAQAAGTALPARARARPALQLLLCRRWLPVADETFRLEERRHDPGGTRAPYERWAHRSAALMSSCPSARRH